jgi:glucosamine--fructose-6-phosphate aminotransferase (isomerizing)
MRGTFMAAEIREQPAVFRRILTEGRESIRQVAAVVRERSPRFVLFAARGTSDHAALYAKYLVETQLQLPAGLVSPSTMTVYEAQPRMGDVLFIAVSQSGSSPDLIEPTTRARRGGALTLAVTNSAASPLAGAAEFHLDILAGPELAVAATKSYTAQLLTLFLLISEIAGREEPALDTLERHAEAVLRREEDVAALAIRYRFAEQLVVTARGYNYPTAREAALKLMETSYLVAHAFSGADLLHGPMAMIDRGFPVIAIAPAGVGGAALMPVLERVRELGADLMVVGGPDALRHATAGFALTAPVPEPLSPLLGILPLQHLAYHLARQRGLDPDEPRGLQKVTETW